MNSERMKTGNQSKAIKASRGTKQAVLALCMAAFTVNAQPQGDARTMIQPGATVQDVASLPYAFDCSALYQETLTYCLDQQAFLGIDANLLVVHFHDEQVSRLEWQLPLTQASYTSVLNGLRKDGYSYAWLFVDEGSHEASLDVLAELPSLTTEAARNQLDQRMFMLANRGDFRTPRTYHFVDRETFSLAQQQSITDTPTWLPSQPRPWVTVQVDGQQLTVIVNGL
ncbi:hypothetical protein JCM19237_5150 [Photobacterium aphoticum]|uniref:Uncharacterized protein n=1 Tax=Photobacterium aphoticum TaxID=754436 RepID=A0A090R3N2_9GAMM|nr:hypothetical protein JCM19237_5150 [Photobacterium aphoticum]